MREHEVDRRTLFRFGLGGAVAAVVGTELALPAAAQAAPSVQRLHGLVPDGKVGKSTWCAVVGGSVRQAFRV
ncbi:hypothetical protein ACFRCW_11450 [Streptomyces sp. NPDC056653]|uniref:hypothetical protein n=1 Tax=Streptomyces sp. NPDC056653 TaxID=3345894 RepID=UPI003687AFE2